MRKVQTDFISQPGKTRENLQLRDDTVSSQAVMIEQDSASFADSSCHSSPVDSVFFRRGNFSRHPSPLAHPPPDLAAKHG